MVVKLQLFGICKKWTEGACEGPALTGKEHRSVQENRGERWKKDMASKKERGGTHDLTLAPIASHSHTNWLYLYGLMCV